MKIPVIKASQKEITLYIGKLKASDLINMGRLDIWDPSKGWDSNDQGYQREPEIKHYKRIGEFMIKEKDPLIPTSALLSIRTHEQGLVHFDALTEDTNLGYLTIDDHYPIYIIDYQHRWRGLIYATDHLKDDEVAYKKLLEFQIPVVIMELNNSLKYEEIRQFYLINNKQKRINTDLALSLMMTMAPQTSSDELYNFVSPGYRYRIRGTRLTFKLIARPNNCWTDKIRQPNDEEKASGIVAIKSFVDSLRPILSRNCAASKKTDDMLLDIIINYWDAIRSLMPSAFLIPNNFLIQKTTGLYTMHIVAGKKVFPMCEAANDYSSGYISSILSKDQDHLAPSFWQTGGAANVFSSGSGHKQLAQLITNNLS